MNAINPADPTATPPTTETAADQPAAAIHAPESVAAPAVRPLREPAVLTLPDWKGAPAAHWLTQWEQQHGLRRVQQHDWQRPLRGDWMMQLQEAVLNHEQCHLLAHGLAAHLVDAWLRHTQQARRVCSVILVDPIDLNADELRDVLFTWKPLSRQAWGLPTAVLWKERAPNPGLSELLEAWGATPLGVDEPVGGGVVGGWSALPEYWARWESAAQAAEV
jgi:predicted alpha/beta hydrolase family esterase